MDTCYCAA